MKTRTSGYVTIAILAVVPFAACKKAYDRAAIQVDEIREEVDSLSAGQRSIMAAVREMDRSLEEEMGVLRRNRADDSATYIDLNERMNRLEARMEDSFQRLERFMVKWEHNLDRLGRGVASAGDSTGAGGDSSQGMAPEGGPDEIRALYDGAYLDLTRGDYELALVGFEEFLKANPGSELADNARYWIGECYYSQEQYLEALAAFRGVLEDYPDGDKVPAALLKMGLTYGQLGDPEKAREVFEKLTGEHPYTEEAAAARARLEDGG